MANKNNIRSIRFSDELAELIDRQVGDTFTQKFENLITRCVWELPAKEAELERIEKKIEEKREQIHKMTEQTTKLSATINNLFPEVMRLEKAIKRSAEYWDK